MPSAVIIKLSITFILVITGYTLLGLMMMLLGEVLALVRPRVNLNHPRLSLREHLTDWLYSVRNLIIGVTLAHFMGDNRVKAFQDIDPHSFSLPLSLTIFICYDLYINFTHIYFHTRAGRWVSHWVHHLNKRSGVFSAFRFSIAELLFYIVFTECIYVFLPTQEVLAADVLLMLGNVFGHSGYEPLNVFSPKIKNVITKVLPVLYGEDHYDHHSSLKPTYQGYFKFVAVLFPKNMLEKRLSAEPLKGLFSENG